MAEGSGPEFAVLQDPDSAAYVQFAARGEGILTVEAVSNDFLPAGEHLGPAQIDWLRARGFSDPHPNHAREIAIEPGEGPRRTQMTQVALEAVEIMHNLYGIPTDTLEVQTDD